MSEILKVSIPATLTGNWTKAEMVMMPRKNLEGWPLEIRRR